MLVVDVPWLLSHVDDDNVRVVDLRWYLKGKRGADEYARGHIPGAVFVDLETEITAPQGPGRHPIPPAPQFEEAMRRAGVSTTTHVVAYDDAGGSVAARLWWLLLRYGHDFSRASVLDGGIDAWTRAGHELSTDAPNVARGDFTARVDAGVRVVDKAHVDRARANSETVLLDARARERYRGDVEPVDSRAGHIPGARSAPFSENLDGTTGRFRSMDSLRANYDALGVGSAREVIVYCGSGVTACHDLMAIALAGYPLPALYEGSWGDWARDASLPAARGENSG